MGREITQEEFSDADYSRFRDRLDADLIVLSELISKPGFGNGPATIGAELELVVVDGACRPFPINKVVRDAVSDPRVTLELTRFNLELNASPLPLAGRPFAALESELNLLVAKVAAAATAHGGRVTAIGILPTIAAADLSSAMVSEGARYRALIRALGQLRGGPLRTQLPGAEPLPLATEDVVLQGAPTSLQIHLRVEPANFAKAFNAVQLATAPVLAVAGNSPTFLKHRLWEESRIALFRQHTEGSEHEPRPHTRISLGSAWLRGGAADLFAESVRLHEPLLPIVTEPDELGQPATQPRAGRGPALEELRLHHGTVWPWNRAVYDPADAGHLRIEMRALPAGPAVIDMAANAAFLIGLSLWLADQDEQWTYALPFECADHNFYSAAQYGLSARLIWPTWPHGGTRILTAAEVISESLPAARQGLLSAGVAGSEADRLLDIIGARVATGQTGAAWQRAAIAAAATRRTATDEYAEMLRRYIDNVATRRPVHTWPPVR
jgi:gamma-glutamyl:cysteine ligase YbdK (ATP-grasp superfamily)